MSIDRHPHRLRSSIPVAALASAFVFVVAPGGTAGAAVLTRSVSAGGGRRSVPLSHR